MQFLIFIIISVIPVIWCYEGLINSHITLCRNGDEVVYCSIMEFPHAKRIIEGKAIAIENAPYQVSLEQSFRHICGGAIITKYFVLTAAHCVHHIADQNRVTEKDLRVRAGTSIAQVGGYLYKVQQVRYPNTFTFQPAASDVGIVRLRKAVEFSPKIRPIRLNGYLPKAGDLATITGYGSQIMGSSSKRSSKNQLMLATVPIFDQLECERMMAKLGFEVSSGMMCAGFKIGHWDACQGDSGGPLTINGSLAGLVSWGIGCGVSGRPGIYTRVYDYIDWIEACVDSIVNGDESCPELAKFKEKQSPKKLSLNKNRA